MVRVVSKYKVKSESLIRGFIDTNNKLVFIFSYIMTSGTYLEYLQKYVLQKKYISIDNNIIDNINNISEIVKTELKINKVYVLYYPKGNQVQRLAKLI